MPEYEKAVEQAFKAFPSMWAILLLMGVLGVMRPLSVDAQSDWGFYPSRLVILTSGSNGTPAVIEVTVTNKFDGPVAGGIYANIMTNSADLGPGPAVVDWSVPPRPAPADLMMRRRFAFSREKKFEIQGGTTTNVSLMCSFSHGKRIQLTIWFLPPNVKPEDADLAEIRVLTGDLESAKELRFD